MKARTTLTTLLLLASLALSQACPVCGPEGGQKASDAASSAILFLLAVVLLVIGGIVSFVVTIALRSRKLAKQNETVQTSDLKSPTLSSL